MFVLIKRYYLTIEYLDKKRLFSCFNWNVKKVPTLIMKCGLPYFEGRMTIHNLGFIIGVPRLLPHSAPFPDALFPTVMRKMNILFVIFELSLINTT